MGLINHDTRRILKLILKPKPSFEITPSAPDPLFRVPWDRPDTLWTTPLGSETRKLQSHIQFSSFSIGDEQDFRFDDILADHCSPLSSRVPSNVYFQACLKSDQDSAIHDTSPTPSPRHRLRRIRRRFFSKSPDHDVNTAHISGDKQFSGSILLQSPIQHSRTVLNPDRFETIFKHSNKDLSPITEGRETFGSPGSLSTVFDTSVGPFVDSASRSTRKLSTASTTDVPFKSAHYFTSQEPSFSGHRGIYPDRSSPKLDFANHSMSTAQSSPVSPLVFADMTSFPAQQPPNLDVSHDLELSGFPVYRGNMIFTADSCAHRSSNVSAAVAEKTEKRLGPNAQLSNKDLARTVNSRPFTSGISTVNSIKAPIVDTAPWAIPSKRIWLRLRHAVTKTFSKRSDIAGVEDSGDRERGSRATHRMSASLLTTGANSVRDQDVTRPSRQLSKPARPASGPCFHRP